MRQRQLILLSIAAVLVLICAIFPLSWFFSKNNLHSLYHCSSFIGCLSLGNIDGILVSIPILGVAGWLILSAVRQTPLRSKKVSIVVSALLIIPLLKYIILVPILWSQYLVCMIQNPSGNYYPFYGGMGSCWRDLLENIGGNIVLLPVAFAAVILWLSFRPKVIAPTTMP
jgi:hypothetical protein